ncbi:MAG: GntR family transcriptional regulator [Steroidobacteraceae bacterium]|nr:GntR family transcriptional regulator [Steroidobacteraceae bacterium]
MASTPVEESPHYRPLYRQVYDSLVRQIAEGAWRPGEALPSEQALAARLGVSQGTVRKALDTLAVEKLIERRQGKGTYVAEHTAERSLFRFFKLTLPDGTRATPTTEEGETVRRRAARAPELKRLGLAPGASVVEINRVRSIDGSPAILERILLPVALFPDIDKRIPLPNALYALYQREYGQNIVAAEEELHADVARREDAKRLGVVVGTPLLHIERVGIGVDGTRVEWRTSRCDTRRLVYAVTLS